MERAGRMTNKPCPVCGNGKRFNCRTDDSNTLSSMTPIENSFYSYAELTEEQKIRFAAYQVFDMPKKASSKLEAAQRWIPVSERLPEPYTRVLACIKSGYMEVDYMYSEPIVDVGIADFNSLDNVTHWMPLPNPPEVQE